MNEQAILHIPDSRYCFAVSRNEIILRLRFAKNEKINEVQVVYAGKYEFYKKQERQKLKKCYTDRLYDYYTVKLKLDDLRLVYIFEIKYKNNILYFSEDGITEYYDFSMGYYNSFQFPYINEADLHYEVKWMRNAVFYEIFVDRFFQGDFRKDCNYINLKWGEKPNIDSFTGGDLRGIILKLDYLKDLGINVIYLTPVFQSISNHKYDISDYRIIDKNFGNNNDMKELIKESHKKGIKIVLDAVFNHCSNEFLQFKDVLLNGKSSPYYNWFIINGDKPDVKLCNYECFASCCYMPKFNTSNIEVQNFLIDIAIYWIKEYDIDGWRLDVSDEVSHEFWRCFRKAVKNTKSDCVIIGENWHDAYPYLYNNQYDSIMNYAFTKACLDFYAFNKFNAKKFSEKLNELLMRNTDQVNNMMLNLLDSHDTHRFLTQINGNVNKLLSAFVVTVMFIGSPCIFYGTEICLSGGYDPDCRQNFDWGNLDKTENFRIKFKKIISLKKLKQLIDGEIKIYETDNLFVIERKYEDKTISLYINEYTKKIRINESGKELISNNYKNGILDINGFIVIEN